MRRGRSRLSKLRSTFVNCLGHSAARATPRGATVTNLTRRSYRRRVFFSAIDSQIVECQSLTVVYG
jgi:hypothetical protein